MTSHITISYVEELNESASIDQFADSISRHGADVKRIANPMPGPFMGVEWLMPTLVIVYLAKPYFEGFLTEAGKDHYQLLRNSAIKLGKRMLGENSREVSLVRGGRVVATRQRYTFAYSIVADLENGVKAKLLIRDLKDARILRLSIDSFLGFLESYHDGSFDPDSVLGREIAQIDDKMLLFAFDEPTGNLKVVDPLPSRVRRNRRGA